MIKRTAALLLTMAYAITAVGFAFDLHYCCNRLASVTINSPVKSCDMAAASKSKCCKNIHVEIKVKDAHQAESGSWVFAAYGFEIPRQLISDCFTFGDPSITINCDLHDPPCPAYPNFLKNCVFRI
jgi:hypothetical protein